MNKFKVYLVGIAVAISVTVSLAIQHRASNRLREQDETRQQQVAEMTRLSADNVRLSNLVAQVKSSNSLSRDELKELLVLRHEVGQLRQAGAGKTQLQKSNASLRAEAAERERKLSEAQAAPNYWPKDQLAYAGYADPESALKTILAAMNNGDTSAWRTMLTPEALDDMQTEMAKRGLSEAQQDAEMKAVGSALTASSAGFHILDETMPAPDEAIINLSFDGEGAARKFVLKKMGDQWKFQDVMVAGQEPPASQ
jgi:hypothetical protein